MRARHPYHTSLKSPVEAPQMARFEGGSVVAVVHDLLAGLPSEFAPCDVLYMEPAWRVGHARFRARAGAEEAAFDAYCEALARLADGDPRPVVLIVGRSFRRRLPAAQSERPILLEQVNTPALALGYRIDLPDIAGTVALIHWLAGRFSCVGDACCGYGNTGRIFVEHGKRAVLSDLNPSCIGIIAATASLWGK